MHTNTDVTNNDPHFRNLVDNALTGILDNTLEVIPKPYLHPYRCITM